MKSGVFSTLRKSKRSKGKNFTQEHFKPAKLNHIGGSLSSRGNERVNMSLLIDTYEIENQLLDQQLNKEFTMDGTSILLDPRQRTDHKKIEFDQTMKEVKGSNTGIEMHSADKVWDNSTSKDDLMAYTTPLKKDIRSKKGRSNSKSKKSCTKSRLSKHD
jgi:hypothetical protein